MAGAGGLAEPQPLVPGSPRYTDLAFPPYRFVPGLNPHPVKDPLGHSFSLPRELPPPWRPDEWRTLTPYLYGVDLYNYAYWWECHETLEGLWHAAGRRGTAADFMHGLIHAAAGNLHRHKGNAAGARRQVGKALARLAAPLGEGPIYMGLDVARFSAELRTYSLGAGEPPEIRLMF